jgi:hypothetical protein
MDYSSLYLNYRTQISTAFTAVVFMLRRLLPERSDYHLTSAEINPVTSCSLFMRYKLFIHSLTSLKCVMD